MFSQRTEAHSIIIDMSDSPIPLCHINEEGRALSFLPLPRSAPSSSFSVTSSPGRSAFKCRPSSWRSCWSGCFIFRVWYRNTRPYWIQYVLSLVLYIFCLNHYPGFLLWLQQARPTCSHPSDRWAAIVLLKSLKLTVRSEQCEMIHITWGRSTARGYVCWDRWSRDHIHDGLYQC